MQHRESIRTLFTLFDKLPVALFVFSLSLGHTVDQDAVQERVNRVMKVGTAFG